METQKPRSGTVLVQAGGLSGYQLLLATLVPLGLVIGGTLGYYFIEDNWTPFDALYMTVITLSTIGYAEVHELSTAGRVFTIILILGGVFTFFYAVTAIIRAVISGEIQHIFGRQRMERTLAQMQKHTIVCGFGRMGRLVCQEFSKQKVPFVAIDGNEESLANFDLAGGIALHGDATSDEVLKHAGIERAQALVAVMASDASNLYTTLSARLLNKDLFIVARVEDSHAEPKLRRAGANRVVSPYQIGGVRLANATLRPTVVDFLELATETEHFALQIEETLIAASSPLAGFTLKDSRLRAALKVIIAVIKKPDGKMIFNPDPESRIEAGDTLVALGPREQLDKLDSLARQ